MKIAVNTRLLLKDRLEGIGWFTFENLSRLTRNHPEHQFYFIFDRPYDSSFIFSDNVHPIVVFPQARHPLLFIIWFEISVNRILKKIKPDVFFSPDGYLSLLNSSPVLLAIHDINFEHSKKDFPRLNYWYLKTFIPKFARKATRIITVSHFSKMDLIEKYFIDPQHISVVYNGVGEKFGPSGKEDILEIRQEFASGQPYFLFIGALHGRKNIINQLLAFDLFKSTGGLPHKYLIVGKKMWWDKEMESAYQSMKFKSEVVFLGHVNSEQLKKLYGGSEALTFVSRLEGFGIPIIEAFACGTPVITSTTSSMPEVAADAALFANPDSVDEIAAHMLNIATDMELRNQLVARAYQRVKEFSWDKSAEEIENLLVQTAKTKTKN